MLSVITIVTDAMGCSVDYSRPYSFSALVQILFEPRGTHSATWIFSADSRWFGATIAIVSCHCGLRNGGTQGVGRSTTQAVGLIDFDYYLQFVPYPNHFGLYDDRTDSQVKDVVKFTAINRF
jgi:hypothetical protein